MTEPQELAKIMMEVVPPALHKIRAEMRSLRDSELTVSQFRILANITRGINRVSDIAKHHGVSQPAMSRMVEGLVGRDYIKRIVNGDDKRNINLELTAAGTSLFKKIRQSAQLALSKKIEALDDEEMANLRKGLRALNKVFFPGIIGSDKH